MIGLTSNFANVRSKSPLLSLRIADGEGDIRSHEITELPAIIGRDQTSEIVLHDSFVSRKNSLLLYSADGVVVQDLDSAHGTIVNGRFIHKHPLSPGDVIRVGKMTSIQVVDIAEEKRFQQATWNVSVSGATLEAAASPPDRRSLKADLLVRTLGKPSRVVSIENFPLLIGRQAGADLQLDDCFASSSHCLLKHVGDGLAVQDLESRNGTKLNGQSIRRSPLQTGDTIEVGATSLTLLAVAGIKGSEG